MADCFYHSEKEAVARCAACGRSICQECVRFEGSMTFCSDECKAKAAAAGERTNKVLSEKAQSNSAALVRKLIYIFVVIAAVAAAWYFCSRHQKSIDSKVSRSVTKMQKNTSKFLKDSKKALPTSSSVKRKAENLFK